ncbi:AbrB/MazE/SpoVT family DNA-binding domain-containing protein [Sphingomonas sp. Leaf357]|uniref:AbrB/MazE/SpoVT family DNA-binding domain-containing protein n=1 Tax=Sphingomonas sp. Leaf357 TaxID=1736350 RepID=UPI0012E1A372|nr:AbrB/MazE/SpoVT family DNA-binding domain-containing protein [Sphingomonas sp. Leaf357]
MTRTTIVHDNGKVTIPPDLMEDLGWRVGDDLVIEHTEAGLVVRRPPDSQPNS